MRDYLVSKGVPKDKIEALGLGEKQLVPGVVCEQKNLKEKIACSEPHRRVEIQAPALDRAVPQRRAPRRLESDQLGEPQVAGEEHAVQPA